MTTATAFRPSIPDTSAYRAGTAPSAEQLAAWVEAFHRDGYIFIENVLPPERCRQLREDLDRLVPASANPIDMHVRMFEHSRANLELFDLDPVVSFAEAVIGDGDFLGKETVHVVHNNSFRTQQGGGWSHWHQDDASHFKVTHGEPPENIHLPCLLLTANYYLTDQTSVENGPGQAVRGSHKWGMSPPQDAKDWTGTRWEKHLVSVTGKAGGVMIFNNQLWHRGAPNQSERMRYVTQVSYARKFIGHKYAPFMNYQMPEHVHKDANPRLKRLLGFLPCGAYG